MNVLRLQECMKLENARLLLEYRITMAESDHTAKECRLEIIKLTSKINEIRRELGVKDEN